MTAGQSTGGALLARAATPLQEARNVVRFVWSHPANDGARTRALLRAVRFQARARLLGRRTLTRVGSHSYMWADLHRTSASKAVYANPPDPEMFVWRAVLGPGDLFVDVGANAGSYTLWAADLGADVIALEPAEDTCAILRENVALNGHHVTTIRAAAGAACGRVRFTSGLDSVNRLDPDGLAETEMVTIDSVIGDRVVAGMKVDVEGFEIEVLRGCQHALDQRRIRLMQLEWNATSECAVGADRGPVAELLAGHGYELCRPGRDGRLRPVADVSYGPDVFARPVSR